MSKLLRPLAAIVLLTGLAGCYGAPAAYYPPPPGTAVYMGTQCAAGAYQCGLAMPGPVGSQCSCPGLGAPSYGVIR